MITRLKLKPGQHGTKALVEQYGDSLVCVRYRYDAATNTRIKTVELIVEKKEIKPTRPKIANDTLVAVKVAYGERELGQMVKAVGGRWDRDVKLWYVHYGRIKGSELEQYMVLDSAMKSGEK